MRETYKDIDIEYNEDKNEWRIFIGNRYDEFERFDSLKSAKAWIDRQNKVKYIPVEIWTIEDCSSYSPNGFRKIKQCTATRPHKRDEFFVESGGTRRARNGKILFLDTPENRRLFPLIAEQERIKEIASNKAVELINQLETLKEMRKVE